MNQNGKKWLGSAGQLGLLLLFAGSLPLLDYAKQTEMVAYPGEVLPAVGLHLLVAAGLYGLACLALKAGWSRLLASMALVYLLMQQYWWVNSIFGPVTHGLPVPAAWNAVLVVGAVLFGMRLLERVVPENVPVLNGLLTGVCLMVVAVNAWGFGTVWAENGRAMSYKVGDPYKDLALTRKPDRDVYYLVFDDYDSNASLKRYLGYDNSGLTDFLRDQGFGVRDDAYANYQETTLDVAAVLNMDYLQEVAKFMGSSRAPSEIPYQTMMRNAPAEQVLNRAGYQSTVVPSWWNDTRVQDTARTVLPQYTLSVLGHHWVLTELQSDALERTFLWYLLPWNARLGGLGAAKATTSTMRQIVSSQTAALEQIADSRHSRPQFVFAHFMLPHSPFIYLPDGSEPAYNEARNNTNVSEKQKYVNQLEYTNQLIKKLVTDIKKKSAKPPVVILLSDEGAAFVDDKQIGPTGSSDANKYKYGTLAAYYLPGVTPDETAKIDSPVNAFRFVVNQYLGGNLPYLPACSYYYQPQVSLYKFYDITSKLHPESQDCRGKYRG